MRSRLVPMPRVAAAGERSGYGRPAQARPRLHDTPLYNSIYRFDDEMIVNTHVYGILAAYTPTWRLRRVDGAYFSTYLESFERVWAMAQPLGETDPQGRLA